jgi:hypothetical protein
LSSPEILKKFLRKVEKKELSAFSFQQSAFSKIGKRQAFSQRTAIPKFRRFLQPAFVILREAKNLAQP